MHASFVNISENKVPSMLCICVSMLKATAACMGTERETQGTALGIQRIASLFLQWLVGVVDSNSL